MLLLPTHIYDRQCVMFAGSKHDIKFLSSQQK